MALTREYVSRKARSIRSVASRATMYVRIDGRKILGTKVSLEGGETLHSQGALKTVRGAVRVIVDELPQGRPEKGQQIEVQEEPGAPWEIRAITSTDYDELRATLRLNYGERYGG